MGLTDVGSYASFSILKVFCICVLYVIKDPFTPEFMFGIINCRYGEVNE